MKDHNYFVYLMTNKNKTVLYIGVTGNLQNRVYEHENGLIEGFTEKYKISDLVYFETHDSAESAITREKQIKKWNRAWKLRLIEEKKWEEYYLGVSEVVKEYASYIHQNDLMEFDLPSIQRTKKLLDHLM